MYGLVGKLGTVFLLSATPVVELRGSIPLGIGVFGLPVGVVMALAFFGNLIPVILVYLLGRRWLEWTAGRKNVLQRITDRTVLRARTKYAEKSARHGMWALPLFVAIPLPLTGAVTGSVAAFVLGIPLRRALPLIAAGVFVADVIVTLATTGTVTVLGFIV